MLAKRIATAIVLLIPLLWALFDFSTPGIATLLGVVVMLAVWELTGLIGFKSLWQRAVYWIVMWVTGLSTVVWVLHNGTLFPLLALATLWWLYAGAHIVREDGRFGGIFSSPMGRAVAGALILLPAWAAMLMLYTRDDQAPQLLLYFLILVWVADSGAYFSGKAWGRHKLAPAVSPGKSVEGVVGGLICVTIIATVTGFFHWQYRGSSLIFWLLLSIFTAAISVVGDLTESLFKRRAGVKDSGQLLPGYGGIFDRIDALTSASPVFALGWLLLPRTMT